MNKQIVEDINVFKPVNSEARFRKMLGLGLKPRDAFGD